MPMRFLIEAQQQADVAPGDTLSVDVERAHYLLKVMRARVGETINCFDGRGLTFTAQISDARPRHCSLVVDAVTARVAANPTAPHLGLALLKGQAMDRAIQQATELGAGQITLLHTQRSNVQLSEDRQDNKLSHWRKIIAGACEQSGQTQLPTLLGPVSLETLLADQTAQVCVLDMLGAALPSRLERAPRLILIGPEGGWDEVERQMFRERKLDCYRVVDLTLRAETMPAVALALFAHLQAAD